MPPKKGQKSFEADVVPEDPMDSDWIKMKVPRIFCWALSPCGHVPQFSPLESLRKESGNQVLQAHFDHERIILISLFESSLGSRSGNGRVYQMSAFYQSSLSMGSLTIRRPSVQTEQQKICRHLYLRPKL